MDLGRTVAAFVTVAAVAAGCGDDDPGAAPAAPVEAPEPGRPAPLPGALADGVVTFEEYDAAVHAFVDCMAEVPIVVFTGGLDEIGVYGDLAMVSDEDPYEIPEAQPCVAAFEPVSGHWQLTAADAFEERHGIGHDELALRRCMDAHGLPWHEGMTEAEMGRAVMAAAATNPGSACDL